MVPCAHLAAASGPPPALPILALHRLRPASHSSCSTRVPVCAASRGPAIAARVRPTALLVGRPTHSVFLLSATTPGTHVWVT